MSQRINSGALRAGDRLQQPDGRTAVVLAVRPYRDAHNITYDLTIPDLHTYYVLAGATAILVHNSNGVCDIGAAARAAAKSARAPALRHRILDSPELQWIARSRVPLLSECSCQTRRH
ncbi:polymorphic toxin-type HINT domain-containing protein [Fodinicola feengrottensis]|uniref:polymorphic toxin-type HINT domain-containing protein n=1 Tax=Fodinicola feengrottensis TaxID=435914 RepID=UPI0013CF9316